MATTPKEYYLMHKDIPVCLMEITEEGAISKVRRNESAKEHFPLGGQMNDMKFHDWWSDRAIPRTRHGAKNALQKLGYATTQSALVNNLGLSLNDCYWICPRGESLTWKEVNLFENDFVDAFGEITINQNYETDLREKTRFSCAASQGELQKKWCIDKNGRRYLVKGNYGDSYQQSLNEIFAGNLYAALNIRESAGYSLVRLDIGNGSPGLGCLCYNFCSTDIESISAWELLQTIKTKQNESLYYPLRQVCMENGISQEDFTEFFDYLIMTDYLLTNTDRHMNNISILRNPDTLEVLGFAPIYDSGNSMFYDVPYDSLCSIKFENIQTHSFIKREVQLLQYVHNRSLVDISKVPNDFSIYEKDITERKIRIPKIKELYCRKIDELEKFQNGKNIWKNEKYL